MRCLLCGVLWISFGKLVAQNLVPNPGFEEYIRCPGNFMLNRNEFAIHGWQSPTGGTPDHFHSCSSGEADVPVNWTGNSNAHSGKGYAGIFVWAKSRNYREYLQCELAEPLTAGEKYILEFYYKLAGNSVYVVNRVGLALSDSPVHLSGDELVALVPELSVVKDTTMTAATGSWEHARHEYVARGGERYVVIGNFFSNRDTQATRLPFRHGLNAMLNERSYYYIDDVSVRLADSTHQYVQEEVVQPLNKQAIELNRVYTLNDIKFEFDSYVIHPSSHDELSNVVAYLQAHPEVDIRVSGHTDFVGSDQYNLVLSRNRAKSVADFLVANGINQHRVITYGFGKTRPLVNDKTEAAQKINRRVELVFVAR